MRFDKDWADIKEDYKKDGITNLFEYAKQQLKKRLYFYKWNEQEQQYIEEI